ncbi:hypothetical protein BGZ65_008903 [Modicella reniformis]|uniref:Uncharacterized protein n=1 Tax=Modicella reniformis TaxID=1440133 RepID=A0A9P6MM79_9FUNG|nr:hypothetical protein BGZ65_008903 [Modicella reniformis]
MDCINRKGLMDPETGSMYIPEVQEGIMARVNLTTKMYDKVPMPPRTHIIEGSDYSHAFAWSAAQRQLIMLEATLGQARPLNAYSYNAADGWKNISQAMRGQVPQTCSESCFVPAYGGSKMILFGGAELVNDTTIADIYVLDVANLTWTKGANIANKDRRQAAACGVSNSQFISWGGHKLELDDVPRSVPNSTLVVYNIKTNRWTSTYIAPPPGPTKPQNSATVTTSTTLPAITPAENSKNSSDNSSGLSIAVPILPCCEKFHQNQELGDILNKMTTLFSIPDCESLVTSLKGTLSFSSIPSA